MYAGYMARPRRGTEPMQVIRLRGDTEDWAAFTTATDGQQAEVTRQFWAWYVRRPGAKLPQRPPRAEMPKHATR
jgi:hypothetical protein